MEFKQIFKKLVDRSGISQTSLSKELGFTPQAVSKWYTGKTEPDTKTIKKIANYFNVSTDYLLGNNENSNNDNEQLEIDILKQLLIKNSYMKPNEDLSQKELDNLMKMAKNNKEFLKGER